MATDVLLPPHQDPVHGQRGRTALPARHIPRLRLPRPRNPRRTPPVDGRRVENVGSVSAGFHVRLPDPAEHERAPIHGPVRPADQPIQREDLHRHLVLARHRLRRDDDRTPSLVR